MVWSGIIGTAGAKEVYKSVEIEKSTGEIKGIGKFTFTKDNGHIGLTYYEYWAKKWKKCVLNKKNENSDGGIVGWDIKCYKPKVIDEPIETKGTKIGVVQSILVDEFPNDGKKSGYYYIKIEPQ